MPSSVALISIYYQKKSNGTIIKIEMKCSLGQGKIGVSD